VKWYWNLISPIRLPRLRASCCRRALRVIQAAVRGCITQHRCICYLSRLLISSLIGTSFCRCASPGVCPVGVHSARGSGVNIQQLGGRLSASSPFVKYKQYVNNPTASAMRAIMKIIARSIVETRISASGEEYSVCWMKPCVERILRERYIPKANRSWGHAQYAEHNSVPGFAATRDSPSCMGTCLSLRDKRRCRGSLF
jgi:hypothetical protein